ncbi:DUF397 domain-containing protein [Streptomyces sp. NPDC004609]|uniref:DUF397 domain-containing protein n=1 Tax=Streptomyces sp. NPDC004609 TaxID=3364704 RepID=UPI0036A78617
MTSTEAPAWRKSSYSGNEDNCLEFADNQPGTVPVRDTKNPGGPALTFTTTAWNVFIQTIKREG